MTVICFHNPDEAYGFLSNWHLSSFKFEGKEFSSLEQYMMYSKAVCFHDLDTATKIMSTDDVALIKALGRSVSDYDDNVWNECRERVVFNGLMAKFSQNASLKRLLLDTGDALLAEAPLTIEFGGLASQ